METITREKQDWKTSLKKLVHRVDVAGSVVEMVEKQEVAYFISDNIAPCYLCGKKIYDCEKEGTSE